MSTPILIYKTFYFKHLSQKTNQGSVTGVLTHNTEGHMIRGLKKKILVPPLLILSIQRQIMFFIMSLFI